MSHGPLSFWDAIPAGFHSQVMGTPLPGAGASGLGALCGAVTLAPLGEPPRPRRPPRVLIAASPRVREP